MSNSDPVHIETYDGQGNIVSTETVEVPLTEHDLERRAIVAAWPQRRREVVEAITSLAEAAPGIVTANQALQAATTTTQVVAAVKQYGNANLAALGAIKDAQEGTVAMMALMERAIVWMDAELAEMAEDGE